MRFAFTADQRDLAAAVRDLLEKECTAAHVRDAWDADDGLVPGLWAQLAEMGVLGIEVHADHGGLGLEPIDAHLMWVELGRAAAPGPLVETAAVAVPLLAAAERTPELAAITAGELKVAAAPFGEQGVAHVAAADRVLLLSNRRTAGAPSHQARYVDPSEASWQTATSVDRSRKLSRGRTALGATGAKTLAATVAGAGDALDVSAGDVNRAYYGALVAHSAVLLGLAQRMLEMTVDHVRERHQFGVPIGTFQAVKHHCADALLALDFARPVVARAAWSLSTLPAGDPGLLVHASMAKAQASAAALTVAGHALQCHGAIGYTTEYDLHLYMKRAWALARAWGTVDEHRERVAAAVLDLSPDT